jgi:RecB family exonuclease
LHALGAARLEDVAELSVATLLGEADAFALPVRRGLVAAEAGDASDVDGAPRALRRGLPRAVLSGAVAAARALLARFAGWPERDRVHVHLQHLRASLCEDLGFAPAGDEFRSLDDKLALLERETPDAMTLSTDEFAWLVRDVLLDIGTTPLGGAGGGVAVLDVTAARARSFERLFVLGMNRDVFPRTMREDPLLPDSLRRALAAALPDLPIKETGYDEERYLFAQLVSASPRVALSWHYVDDDGQARARSPLLERLCAEAGVKETRAPSPAARPAQSAEKRPRPASEYALLAGLYGSRDQFARILPAALRESRSELRALDSRVEAEALARARFGVLCELDPDLRSRRGRERARSLGPYCGFLGPTQESADPRRSAPFVTTLERMAGCAWQVLLEKLLRLEPTPDALEALPAVDALLIGNTVHRVLEQIAGPATEDDVTLREVLSRSPRRVRWPPEAELARILASAADRVRRDAGYALPGFTRVLVALAQPYLAAARERLPELFALGTEVVGSVPEPEGDRPIRFRADLVERVDGAARITDYKTGKPLSDKKRPSTRQAELARRIARGTNLQAVAYALGADEPDATGRYLFLKPELDSDAASLGVDASDADRVADFRRAVGTVFAAWDAGSFFPRLSEPGKDGEPARCGWCPVSQACLRGDSGARRRLRACAEEAGAAAPDTAPAEAAFASLWQLPARQAAGSEERT